MSAKTKKWRVQHYKHSSCSGAEIFGPDGENPIWIGYRHAYGVKAFKALSRRIVDLLNADDAKKEAEQVVARIRKNSTFRFNDAAKSNDGAVVLKSATTKQNKRIAK